MARENALNPSKPHPFPPLRGINHVSCILEVELVSPAPGSILCHPRSASVSPQTWHQFEAKPCAASGANRRLIVPHRHRKHPLSRYLCLRCVDKSITHPGFLPFLLALHSRGHIFRSCNCPKHPGDATDKEQVLCSRRVGFSFKSFAGGDAKLLHPKLKSRAFHSEAGCRPSGSCEDPISLIQHGQDVPSFALGGRLTIDLSSIFLLIHLANWYAEIAAGHFFWKI